jgi:short-subunit dehydrogenase
LTESLNRDLQGTGVGASVLCPMVVSTAINQSERNRPADLQNPGAKEPSLADMQLTASRSIEAADVAERVVAGIREKALYILTHEESREILRRRAARLDKAAERVFQS